MLHQLRSGMAGMAGMALSLVMFVAAIAAASSTTFAAEASAAAKGKDRPNILWITAEDISSHLGCYGDKYAVTPNLDRLAAQGVRYTHAFAPIGVCAPARSCLITGMYPPSIGSQHMRCRGTLPKFVRCFPEYLRKAGYYCSNNSKTDYNFQYPTSVWNESSRKAHWRKRKPGQPFFSVFNFTSCHESQIRLPEKAYQRRVADFTDKEKHDPAKAPVPPYHPNTPEVRKDWARYADMITYMDRQVAGLLKQLADDGLAESTIVFFYSDHGAGMPRSKRWLYDSSTRVPFFVRFPKKYQSLAPGAAGSTTDRLISFVDFGPTALSLAGLKIPKHMQGKAFLGPQATQPRKYVYGYRDRMDERYDMIRSVRDRRYNYIRNYMPHLPWFHDQHISYMYQMPTMKTWQRLADAGKLSGPTAIFMSKTKPMEELYDTEADPHEVRNLAGSAKYQEILQRMRKESRRWMEEIIDLGLLPEADLRSRFGKEPQYEAVRRQPSTYPIKRIAAAADLANQIDPRNASKLLSLLADNDPAVRYWACIGLGSIQTKTSSAAEKMTASLADNSPFVRVAAADALCRNGRYKKAVPALANDLEDKNEWVRLAAINVLDRIDEEARPVLSQMIKSLNDKNGYVVRVTKHALDGLRK